MNKLNGVDVVAIILIIVGGLNWGLVGLLNFNLVTTIFGDASSISKLVYILVGIAALYAIPMSMKLTKK